MASRNAPSWSAVQTFALGTTTLRSSASGAGFLEIRPARTALFSAPDRGVVDPPHGQRAERLGDADEMRYAGSAGMLGLIPGCRLGAALGVDLFGFLDLGAPVPAHGVVGRGDVG